MLITAPPGAPAFTPELHRAAQAGLLTMEPGRVPGGRVRHRFVIWHLIWHLKKYLQMTFSRVSVSIQRVIYNCIPWRHGRN